MKRLFLVRHAKSSWEDASVFDFDRVLNSRGEKDAPKMAKRLLKLAPRIDFFVSSPAKRALQTASRFAKAYEVSKSAIQLEQSLYLAERHTFYSVISGFADLKNNVAVFSHNGGITDFANSLTNMRVDDMPTCAIFAVEISTDKWEDFEQAEKKFLFFEYPKKPMTDAQSKTG